MLCDIYRGVIGVRTCVGTAGANLDSNADQNNLAAEHKYVVWTCDADGGDVEINACGSSALATACMNALHSYNLHAPAVETFIIIIHIPKS